MLTSKQQLLDQIKADIISQNICPDLAQEAKNLVMGDGSVDSNLFFIGEAPGKQEDKLGIPFVGASGKLLDSMLASINLNRLDVYITNIVKYRPPNNRDPSTEEKLLFLPFLKREIAVIKPKIIVTLGRHSMDFFLPDKKISDIHGKSFQISIDGYKFYIIPIFHPAAALYNGSLRNKIKLDFLEINKLINKIK